MKGKRIYKFLRTENACNVYEVFSKSGKRLGLIVQSISLDIHGGKDYED
jgi:hypothetical protein